ncbi:dienelactone hydrolase family protein [Pararhizobium polonicum]|uniref:dienelactone hydrolase family protein n=1 Tax=Pararhizobium polonicum TaxID=1612624 RepID=UPI00083A1DE9|nr:dienelactone hydrolase family protein [Pararhizobium polonicum]
MIKLLLQASLAVVLLASVAHGQSGAKPIADKSIPARVEFHPIHSLTITDTQYLNGDANGKEVVLGGELSIAQGKGPLPIVVLMHGSGGVGPNIQFWRRHFNSMGISTFIIDGMTGRSLTSVGDNQALLGRLNFSLDIFRSLDILAKHPRVDPDRIILMGFSRGGQGALYSSVSRFQKMWNKSGVDFAGYVIFYPDCGTTYRQDGNVQQRPIRIFHGARDDYNPVRTCKAYAERLKNRGVDISITEYPNAEHGFDNPLGANPPMATKADQSVRDCEIKENDHGILMNAETNAPFSYRDACVKLKPVVGQDPEATRAAIQAVTEFVKSTLKL